MASTQLSSVPPSKKRWLISALLFGLPMGVFFSVQAGNYSVGMPIGLVAGVFFSTFMSRFAGRLAKTSALDRPDFGTETLIHEGPANHFKGIEGVGGFLWLTTGRLHFCSHKMNIQKHDWIALLADISTVQSTKTLGIIANGLLVQLSSGEEHRFVVNQNEHWASSIMNAKTGRA